MKTLALGDGGWKSRKLIFAAGCCVLLFVAWLLTGFVPMLQAQFTTLVGGITAVYALFAGANVGNSLVVGNHLAKIQALQIPAVGADGSLPDTEDPASP